MAGVTLLLAASLLALATAAEPPPKPAVAVLYFDYAGQDEDLQVLRKGLAAMLISDLAAGGAVRVVERARLQEVLSELALGQGGKVEAATAARVGKLLGARYLVLGSYFAFQGQLVVHASVVETETGVHLGDTRARGKPEDFLELEQRLAEGMQSALAKVAAAPAPPPVARRGRPVPQKAVVQYSKALEALDRKDAAGARSTLEGVVKANPEFAQASAELVALLR